MLAEEERLPRQPHSRGNQQIDFLRKEKVRKDGVCTLTKMGNLIYT